MSDRDKTWPISTDLIEKGEKVTGEQAVAQARAWLYDGDAEDVESAYRSGRPTGCRWLYTKGDATDHCMTCGDISW